MPTYYCPNGCADSRIGFRQSSGPLIAGHILANANLPIVGTRFSGSMVAYCDKCGADALPEFTEEEKKQTEDRARRRERRKDIMLIVLFIASVLSLLLLIRMGVVIYEILKDAKTQQPLR
jgi:hypothetical protein